MERTLETYAFFLALGGMFLSLFRKKFLLLSASVLVLLNQHAQQGCPPQMLAPWLSLMSRKDFVTHHRRP